MAADLQVKAADAAELLLELIGKGLGLDGNIDLGLVIPAVNKGIAKADGHDSAGDSAADFPAADAAAQTAGDGQSRLFIQAGILAAGGKDTLGAIKALGMILGSFFFNRYIISPIK